jgi:hypothetical protein
MSQSDLSSPWWSMIQEYLQNHLLQTNASFLFWFVGPLSFRPKVVGLAFVCRCCVLQQVVMLHFFLLWTFCLCLRIFPSVQESHLHQQVIMHHFVLLWKFWLVSRHLSFCSGVTFTAVGRHATLCFAVEVLTCVRASFLLFRSHLSRHLLCG